MAGPSGASKKGKTDKTRTGKGRNTKDDTIYCGYFKVVICGKYTDLNKITKI